MLRLFRTLLIGLLATLLVAPQPVSAQEDADPDAVIAALAVAGLSVDDIAAESANSSWDGLGMFSEDMTRLLAASSNPFEFDTYAFGDSKDDPPVINPTGTNPTESGAAVLTIPEGWSSPAEGMGDTAAFASAAGGRVVPGDEVLFLWTEFDSNYDFGQDDLTINEGFPLTVPGLPVWNSSFAGDTWEGANVIPNAVYDGVNLTFDVKGYQPPQSFPLVAIPGFYYRSGNVMAMALDATALRDFVNAASTSDTAAADDGVNSTLLYTGGAETVTAQSADPLFALTVKFFVHAAARGLFLPGFIAFGPTVFLLIVLLVVVVSTLVLVSLISTATTSTTTTTTTTTTTLAPVDDGETAEPASDPAPATTSTSDGGGFPWIAILVIAIFLILLGLWLMFGSKKKDPVHVGGTRVRKRKDLHSTPRDVTPPVHTDDRPACDWALVFMGDTQTTYLKKPAPGKVECCTYYIKVQSSVWMHAQTASFRQGLPPVRQYIPDIDFSWNGIGYNHNASTRSGPAGRQDWQHGDGDPIDQAALGEGEGFFQRAQGEERPEVVAQIGHQEATTVRVWLEAGCTGHENLFEARSDGELMTLLTSECTNDAPGESCPVELTAQGLHDASVFGDLAYTLGDWTGSDVDELERYGEMAEEDEEFRMPMPAPVKPGKWDGHTHDTSLQTPTREQSFSSSDHRVKDGDRFQVQFNSTSWCESAQLVPEAVHDTTERVSCHSDARFAYNLWIRGTMKKEDCTAGQCAGHPGHVCHGEPTFELRIDQDRQQVLVDGLYHYFERVNTGDRQSPPPLGTWRRWELL